MALIIRNVFILFWTLFVAASYLGYFPVSQLLGEFPSLPWPGFSLNVLSPLFILPLLLFSASGYGKIFWHKHSLSHLERFVFSSGFGFGLMALIILTGGLFGITAKLFYLLILIVGLVLFFMTSTKLHATITEEFKIIWLIAAIPLIGTLIGALAPPTQYDSLVYHLAIPKEFLRRGIIHKLNYNFFAAFPENLEMLFMSALSMEGDTLANLIHWLFYPLTAISIFTFTKRFFNPFVSFFSTLFWLFLPITMFLSTGTYVDLGLTFFIFLAFYSLIIWLESDSVFFLISCAVFCGFSLGTKYTAALPLSIIFFLILLRSFKTKALTANVTIFGTITFAVFFPWILKNIIFFSNPVAPWGWSLFGGARLQQGLAQGYFVHILSHGIAIKNIFDVITVPWNVTMQGLSYGGAFDLLGPAFLIFIPLLFFKSGFDRITKVIVLFVICFASLWMVSGKVLRFIVPVVPLLCVLTALGVQTVYKQKYISQFIYAAVFLVFFHNIITFFWVMGNIDPFGVAFARETRSSFLSRKINSYNAISSCVNMLPKNSRVLCWGETRSYYFDRANITPTVFDQNPIEPILDRSTTVNEAAEGLKNLGVTHIFVNKFEVERLGFEKGLKQPAKLLLSKLLKESASQIFEDKYCSVYELKDR
jgi:hypothetical protein